MGFERTLVIIKPGAVYRNCTGQIIDRYERASLLLPHFRKNPPLPMEFWWDFYADLKARVSEEIYLGHTHYMSSGQTVTMIVAGENAIARVRNLNGPTNPLTAPPGSIRGDFGGSLPDNAVHASDGLETAQREILFWKNFYGGSFDKFGPSE